MIIWLIISFLLSITSCIFVNQISTENFCKVKTCPANNHTMCKYTSPQYSHLCEDSRYVRPGLSRDEQLEILSAHNYLRSFVARGKERRGYPGPQPRARNLGPLVWSDKLAMVAQRWANQCMVGHDQCRDFDEFRVGQNIAFSSTSTEFPNNMTSIVLQWYDEVQDFDRQLVNELQFTTAFVFHYTQMMWAKTKQIGCGGIRYKKHNYWYTTYVVCNYGPSGNMIGEPIYEIY